MQISKQVAQKYVRRLMASEHESLKWVWTILMAGAFVEATIKFSNLLPCGYNLLRSVYEFLGLQLLATTETLQAASDVCTNNQMAPYSLGVFIIFLITFLRFFWGDNRLLDAKYKEVVGFLDDLTDLEHNGEIDEIFEEYIQSYSRRSLVLDACFIVLHGVIIALLGLVILDPYLFSYGYGFLLIFNSIWLILVTVLSMGIRSNFWANFLSNGKLTGDLTAMLAPWRWASNNIIHAVLLIFLFSRNEDSLIFFGQEHTVLGWAIIVMLSNSIIDILFTRNAYLPRVKKIYRELIE